MGKPGVLNFKVGQVAEMRTFQTGFRGAWFRCKIHDLQLKKNKIKLEYFDYELEAMSWVKIYQVPPFAKKTKLVKKQLMVRPQYPVLYHKNETPPANSMSQACIVIGDTWKVGNLVDWFKDDCFWSAKIVKVLRDGKVQIVLPMPPIGQGKEGEEGKHEAFNKDLRPSLDWSETKGWTFPIESPVLGTDPITFNKVRDIIHSKRRNTLPVTDGRGRARIETVGVGGVSLDFIRNFGWWTGYPKTKKKCRVIAEGHTPCDAQLIFPTEQGMDLQVEDAAAVSSPVNASSTTHTSMEGDRERENEKNVNKESEVEHAVATAAGSSVNASSSTRIPAEGDRENEKHVKMDSEVEHAAGSSVNASSSTRIPAEGGRENEKNAKVNCDLLVESSECISSLRVGKRKAAERRELNIMHEDTLEAAIIDLEELVNKVKWMQRLLCNDATTSTWK